MPIDDKSGVISSLYTANGKVKLPRTVDKAITLTTEDFRGMTLDEVIEEFAASIAVLSERAEQEPIAPYNSRSTFGLTRASEEPAYDQEMIEQLVNEEVERRMQEVYARLEALEKPNSGGSRLVQQPQLQPQSLTCYHGVFSGEFGPSVIQKGMADGLQQRNSFKFSYYDERVFFAYPASEGWLKDIRDQNDFPYLNSFINEEVFVNGKMIKVYYSKKRASGDMEFTFIF